MDRRTMLSKAATVGSLAALGGCVNLPSQTVDAREYLPCEDVDPRREADLRRESEPPQFEERWRGPGEGEVAAVTDDQVIGYGPTADIIGIDRETGEQRWVYERPHGLSGWTRLGVDGDATAFTSDGWATPGTVNYTRSN